MRSFAALALAAVSCGDDTQDAPLEADASADADVADAARDAAVPDGVELVRPAWDEPAGPLAPALFGHNAVWVRGGLGLWDEEAGRVDPAVRDLVATLAPGMLRFPGGTRAMRYDFSRAIGPVAEREPQCDTFLGTFDDTTWGLDEALAFAADVGAEVSLVSSWVDGSPEQTAAMVAYANAPLGADVAIGVDVHGRDWGNAGDWAQRRADNGHPEPWGVAMLEIGNEPYLALAAGPADSCGRPSRFRQSERWVGGAPIPTTARDHAEQVALTGALVRAVDPAIRVAASALAHFGEDEDVAALVASVDEDLGTGDPWNPRLVADAGDAFDAFVLHPYHLGEGDPLLAERLREAVTGLAALAPDKRVAVTEFGFLLNGGTLLNAIVTADTIRVAAEMDLDACLRHLLIEDDPNGLFAGSAAILGPEHDLAPAYHLMAELAAIPRDRRVAVTSAEPERTGLASTDAAGDAFAVVLADRRESSSAAEVWLELPAGAWGGETVVLAASDWLATDVAPVRQPFAAVEGHLSLELPEHAVVVVHARRGGS